MGPVSYKQMIDVESQGYTGLGDCLVGGDEMEIKVEVDGEVGAMMRLPRRNCRDEADRGDN